jgi:NTE family protein
VYENLYLKRLGRRAISVAAAAALILSSRMVACAAESSACGGTADGVVVSTVAAVAASETTTTTEKNSTSEINSKNQKSLAETFSSTAKGSMVSGSKTTTITTTTTTATKTEIQSGRPRIALALGGGGTRGAAHVGVLRVLEREGIHVDMITGTSIGAIVGGLYCAGLSVDDIESRFRKPKLMKSYMTVPVFISVAARPFFLMPRLVGWKPFDGFYFGNKFRNYYKSCLPPGRRDIEDLKLPFCAMTTNLRDGEPFPITHGDLSRAVQASSAIPVLRRAVRIDDQVLVDGCVVINVPVDEARKMGADIVIAVPVNERLERVPVDTFRHVGSVARRIEQIFLARTDAPQLARADVVIHPVTDGIDVVSTNPKDAIRSIQSGIDAANQAMPEIKRHLDEWSIHHGQP